MARIDPGEQKKEIKAAAIAAQKEAENTFENVAREWYAHYAPSLTQKHALKLMRYLQQVFFPAIGGKPVTELGSAHILDAIRPLEAKGLLNTSHRLVNLASQVLGYAVIKG